MWLGEYFDHFAKTNDTTTDASRPVRNEGELRDPCAFKFDSKRHSSFSYSTECMASTDRT